jgi:glycosyltransferase involved in cell wall biosynthesis
VAVAPASCDVVSLGQEKGFAVSADPQNAEEFAQAVRTLAQDQALLRKMGDAARQAAPEYDRQNELRKLVAVVGKAATGAATTKAVD